MPQGVGCATVGVGLGGGWGWQLQCGGVAVWRCVAVAVVVLLHRNVVWV